MRREYSEHTHAKTLKLLPLLLEELNSEGELHVAEVTEAGNFIILGKDLSNDVEISAEEILKDHRYVPSGKYYVRVMNPKTGRDFKFSEHQDGSFDVKKIAEALLALAEYFNIQTERDKVIKEKEKIIQKLEVEMLELGLYKEGMKMYADRYTEKPIQFSYQLNVHATEQEAKDLIRYLSDVEDYLPGKYEKIIED